MVRWEIVDVQGMTDLNGQALEVMQRHPLSHITSWWFGQYQLLTSDLDRNLPGTGRAEKYLVAQIFI